MTHVRDALERRERRTGPEAGAAPRDAVQPGTVQPDAVQPDTVLLDVDGTLVDSTYHHALAWWRAFDDRDLDVAVWRIHRSIGMGGDRLVAEVAGEEVEREHGDAVRAGWKARYDRDHLELVRPFAGAAGLVRELRRRGWRVALASSGKPDHTSRSVELLGVADDVDAVTSADDAEESKPAPDILVAALRRAGGRAGICVGDSVYDVRAAAALGAPCIGVLTGGFSAAELREAGAVAVATHVGELAEALDGSPLAAPAR
jgi:HAD superfamily hydrolase (TIGR01549 family)